MSLHYHCIKHYIKRLFPHQFIEVEVERKSTQQRVESKSTQQRRYTPSQLETAQQGAVGIGSSATMFLFPQLTPVMEKLGKE